MTNQNGKLKFLVALIMAMSQLHCVSTTPHYTTNVIVNSSADCTNGTSHLTYCQLSDALSKENGSYTKILVSSSTYTIDSPMTFSCVNNFSLVGECTDDGINCSKVMCANGGGFWFYNSTYIQIQNIELIECGMAYHSDLAKYTIAAFVFELCANFNLTAVTFQSRQTGLAIINPSDLVLITDCMFLNSSTSENVYGGGVQLYFSGKPKGFVVLQNCHLSNNKASFGGGLYVNMTHISAKNRLLVQNCHFEHNMAMTGGGMFTKLNGKSNSIVVVNTTFNNNACYKKHQPFQCYGGAVSLELFAALSHAHPENNQIIFKQNCFFSFNNANSGAGVSVTTARLSQANNLLSFSKVYFQQNNADFGFAVYVHAPFSQSTGEYFNISISDCIFSQNGLLKTAGQGVVYIADVPVQFEGNVAFKHNKGTALAVASTQVSMTLNTVVIFSDNEGNLGGAIALLKGATVKLYNSVFLNFTRNHAELKGGAIYASDLYWDSLTCPIHHVYDYTNYSVWNETVYLRNNSVGKDKRSNSVFVPSKLTCLGEHSQQEQPFCWKDWDYGTNCSREVQTSPSWINFTNETISVFPGQPIYLPLYLQLYDDYGNDVTKYSIITVLVSTLSYSLTVTSNFNITISGNTTLGNQTLTIITAEPRVIRNSTNLKFTTCPPGYHMRQNTCKCAKKTYGGPIVLSCSYSFKASMYWIHCMTLYNNNKATIVSGICWPYLMVNMTEIKDGYVMLPTYTSLLDEYFCLPMNRNGTLCSKCRNGFGHPVLSYEVKCVKCESSDLLWNLLKYSTVYSTDCVSAVSSDS